MKKITMSMGEILYYLFLALILFSKGIGLDEGELLFRVCLVTGMAFLAGKFLLDDYSVKEILVIVLLGIFSIRAFFVTGSLGLFIYVLIITGSKNIPLKRIFQIGTIIWSLCMLLSFTLAIFGDRKGVMLVHEKFGIGPILRESLGYTHPNVLHITYVVFMAFVLYNCSKKKKKTLLTILELLIGDVFVFMYSVSITGMIASLILVIFFLYFELRERRTKIENIGIMLILPFCVLISTVAPLLGGDSSVFMAINKFFNSRLIAIRVFFYNQGLSLFGARFMESSFAVDNSYAYALLQYGIVFFVVMMLTYFALMYYLIRKNQTRELAITSAFLIAGISEPFLFNASIKNITVFFVGTWLYTVLEQESNNSFFNRKIKLLSRKNRNFTWNISTYEEKVQKMKQESKRFVIGVVCIVLLACTAFAMLTPFRQSQVTTVYSDPKLTDLDEGMETKINLKKDGSELIIGDLEDGDIAYCFTRENSMLIQIMDWRRLISFVFYGCGVLIAVWWLSWKVKGAINENK